MANNETLGHVEQKARAAAARRYKDCEEGAYVSKSFEFIQGYKAGHAAVVRRAGKRTYPVVTSLRELLRHCDLKSSGETDFERAVIAARRALAQWEAP